MGVKATFQADFTSFMDAVQKANVSLDKFQGTTAGVEKSLNRMVDSFTGRKVISEAVLMAEAVERVGGSSKLTEAELRRLGATAQEAVAKMKALGVDIPPGVQKLANETQGLSRAQDSLGGALTHVNGLLASFGLSLSVGALAAFTRAVLADADMLTRLSDKTGVSIEWLQKFRIVTDDTGDSLDSLATGVNKLQQNLGRQNPEALKALRELHLNYEAIRALSPEDQFLQIAAALRQVDDQDRQVALGTALMGRGFSENLATIKKGFDEVKEAAVASTSTIRAIDDLGDHVTAYWRKFKTVAAEAFADVITLTTSAYRQQQDELDRAIADLDAKRARNTQLAGHLLLSGSGMLPSQLEAPGAPSGGDLDALERSLEAQRKAGNETNAAAKAAEEYARKLATVDEKIREATRDLGHLSETQQASILKYEAMGLSVEDIAIKLNVSALAVKRFSDNTKQMDAYLESLTAHIGAKAIPNFAGLTMTWEQMLNTGKGLTYDGLIPMVKGFDDAARAELALKLYADDLTKSHVALQTQVAKVIGLMPDLSRVAAEHMDKLRESTGHERDAVKDLGLAFEDLGRQIGGVMGDAVSQLGFFITKFEDAKTAADKWAAAIQGGIAFAGGFTSPGSRGSNIAKYAGQGAAIGSSILPGYGTAVGAGVGALVGAFKVPDDEKAARDQFNAFKHQLDAMFDATASGTHRVEAGGDAWNKMLIQVREAYLATGRTAEQALADIATAERHTRQDVEQLPDDLAKLNEALQQAAQDQDDLGAAMTKYKFTIEEMGPAFQRQELTKQALELENNFRLLVGAGADASLVIDRMGDDINAFIHTALKTGTEVPKEMQPMLEQMVKMGKLTDENGNVIDDLGASGIKWSETMTAGFDRVVTALEKVLKALGWVDDAVGKLPDDHPIHIPIIPVWQELPPGIPDGGFPSLPQPVDSFASMGGRVTPNGLQYFAAGGNVLRFQPKGTDTVPAMLTPGERVLSVAQARAYTSFLAGDDLGAGRPVFRPLPTPNATGNGGVTTTAGPVTVNIYPIITSEDAKDQERVIGIIETDLRDNGRLYTAVQAIAKRAVA